MRVLIAGERPQLTAAAREARRALRPEGQLLSDPHPQTAGETRCSAPE